MFAPRLLRLHGNDHSLWVVLVFVPSLSWQIIIFTHKGETGRTLETVSHRDGRRCTPRKGLRHRNRTARCSHRRLGTVHRRLGALVSAPGRGRSRCSAVLCRCHTSHTCLQERSWRQATRTSRGQNTWAQHKPGQPTLTPGRESFCSGPCPARRATTSCCAAWACSARTPPC